MTEDEKPKPPTPSTSERMSDEKAIRYIEKAVLSGETHDQIREYLKENGFTDAEIDKLLEEYADQNKPAEPDEIEKPDDGSDGP